MNILHIDCSPRDGSQSRQLSAAIVRRVVEIAPGATIMRRDLGREPIPHASPAYAALLSSPAAMAAGDPHALHLSELLIDEVERSDVIVLGTPMHNFTAPSVLKAWIDQLLRVGRTIAASSAGKVGLLADRPVLVGIASGGIFAGDRANQPDFLRPYLEAAFGCVGLMSIRFFPVQATAFLDEATLAAVCAGQVASIAPSMLGDRT